MDIGAKIEEQKELREFETEVYLMAALAAFINRNYLLDLGDYEMESEIQLADRLKVGINKSEASLVILIRIRNQITGELEYANAFYKTITKNKSFDKGNAEEIIDGIFDSDKKTKLAFILRNETRVLKSMFIRSFYVHEFPFLEKFKKFDGQGNLYMNIGGTPSPEIVKAVEENFMDVVAEATKEVKAERNL